jgi:hypothetical protein
MKEKDFDTRLDGMATCLDLVYKVIEDVNNSIEEVRAIYTHGYMGPEKLAQTKELLFAIDTLAHVKDRIEEDYFEKLDSLKKKVVE